MSKIKRVEGNENLPLQDLKSAEQKIFDWQDAGYGPLAIMYFLAEYKDFSVSLTGINEGYVETIS